MAVCILNYKNYGKAYKCLKSCLNQNGQHDIFLFDNVSNDGSYEQLKKEFDSKIIFVKNDINLGFAKGNNEIIKQMKNQGYSHTLLLNNDTEFVNIQTLNKLKKAVFDNWDAGIIAPIIINKRLKGDERVKNTSILIKMLLLFGIIPRCKKNNTKRYKKVYTAHGSALVVNNDIFLKVGGFPEENFMYGEETTFCRKVTLLRVPIVQCLSNDCIMFHNHELEYSSELWRKYLMGRNTYLEIKLYSGYKRVAFRIIMSIYKIRYKLKRTEENKIFLQGLEDAKKILNDHLSDEEIRQRTIDFVKKYNS